MIRHDLRCRAGSAKGEACLLARITSENGALVADVRRRFLVGDVGDDKWLSDSGQVSLADVSELLLSCRHSQGIVVSVDAIRALIRNAPEGVTYCD